MFLSQFSSNVPRNSLLPIPGIPILSGCRPNWDINPIFSIHFFYLNSCALFQLLFTPTTGYRFKSLSNVPVYIIPLSVYTTQTCNKLNYLFKRCWKCALQSLYRFKGQSVVRVKMSWCSQTNTFSVSCRFSTCQGADLIRKESTNIKCFLAS